MVPAPFSDQAPVPSTLTLARQALDKLATMVDPAGIEPAIEQTRLRSEKQANQLLDLLRQMSNE